MPRPLQVAARAATRPVLGVEPGLLALWILLAAGLSAITAQVTDWNAMTDELVWERLAISIGQTHSLLPTLHGEHVRSLAQLYPALISPFFWGGGSVSAALRNAHVLNAWVMSSACIPAFLLARRVTGRRWPAYALAFVTVCMPWIVYATTLLTEVVGYPAFVWALLAIHATIASPSRRNDALAVLALAVAFFARQQLLVLAGVLPVALLLFHLLGDTGPVWGRLREALRRHVVLAAVYAALAAAALGVIASGGNLVFLSVYGGQLTGKILPRGALGAFAGHAADLAFGLGILPFVVGAAWLVANALRPPAGRELRAFACVGLVVTAALLWSIATWDLHIGSFVIDRYLFYLLPPLVLATFCAVLDARRPRWSLLLPVALVAYGFAAHLQAEFTWEPRFPLNTDSPIASVYRPLTDLGGGTGGASAILAVATVVLATLFVLGDRLLPHRRLVAVVAALVLLALPLGTVRMFDQLFSMDGPSSRPLTGNHEGDLGWIDQTVGSGAHVTEIPYPISSSYDVSHRFWRDVEFWNKSVRYGVHSPDANTFADAIIWFPNNVVTFDPRTGIASRTLSPYVVQSVIETRFRISGVAQRVFESAMLIDAERPWRTDWLTSGLYNDGWMRPGEPARIRLFSTPGQRRARTRTLSLQFQTPEELERPEPFVVRSNLGRAQGTASQEASGTARVDVCVPAKGSTDVVVTTPFRGEIPGDQTNGDTVNQKREGGLLVAQIALADEIGPPCQPGRR